MDDGYTLLYPHNQPHVYLLDFCGEVVHTWTNEDTLRPGNMAYLQENGDLILTYRPQVFSNDPIWASVERRNLGQRNVVVLHLERQHSTFAPRH